MAHPANQGTCDRFMNFLKDQFCVILLWAFLFLIDVGKSDKMKTANVKLVPDSSAGCVGDHTYDSEIENSSNSEEEQDEEKETESQHDDNTPIIMTTK